MDKITSTEVKDYFVSKIDAFFKMICHANDVDAFQKKHISVISITKLAEKGLEFEHRDLDIRLEERTTNYRSSKISKDFEQKNKRYRNSTTKFKDLGNLFVPLKRMLSQM